MLEVFLLLLVLQVTPHVSNVLLEHLLRQAQVQRVKIAHQATFLVQSEVPCARHVQLALIHPLQDRQVAPCVPLVLLPTQLVHHLVFHVPMVTTPKALDKTAVVHVLRVKQVRLVMYLVFHRVLFVSLDLFQVKLVLLNVRYVPQVHFWILQEQVHRPFAVLVLLEVFHLQWAPHRVPCVPQAPIPM